MLSLPFCLCIVLYKNIGKNQCPLGVLLAWSVQLSSLVCTRQALELERARKSFLGDTQTERCHGMLNRIMLFRISILKSPLFKLLPYKKKCIKVCCSSIKLKIKYTFSRLEMYFSKIHLTNPDRKACVAFASFDGDTVYT